MTDNAKRALYDENSLQNVSLSKAHHPLGGHASTDDGGGDAGGESMRLCGTCHTAADKWKSTWSGALSGGMVVLDAPTDSAHASLPSVVQSLLGEYKVLDCLCPSASCCLCVSLWHFASCVCVCLRMRSTTPHRWGLSLLKFSGL